MDSSRLLQGLASGLLGAVISYGISGVKVESRVHAIEQSILRIEARLYAPTVAVVKESP